MSYFQRRVCRVSAVVDEFVRELLKLSYHDLVKERIWLESLLKHPEGARRLGLIPKELADEELAVLICAYRRAVRLSETEILKKAFLRGRA